MRPDLEVISGLINPRARVLDLGCGDGELLAYLQSYKQVTGYGVEKDPGYINECLHKGVNVIEHDINRGLERFPDDSFDMVVVTETLQVTDRPKNLLEELLRIGEECIVTFPNFAHWTCRIQLMLKGLMPVSKHLPHQWYDTPNIHLCTLHDFDKLLELSDLRVIEKSVVDSKYQSLSMFSLLPNLFGYTAFYRLGRTQ